MFSDNPPLLIKIKHKTQSLNSNTNITSKESQQIIEDADRKKSQGNIPKTVRFSCPQELSDKNSRSNSTNTSRQKNRFSVRKMYCKPCRRFFGDNIRRKIRNIHHSNISRVRKKVRLQFRKNFRNQFGKHRSNSSGKREREVSNTLKSGRKSRSPLRIHSDLCNRKLSSDRNRRKCRDTTSEKEREINAKIAPDVHQSRERTEWEMPCDKSSRNSKQSTFKSNTQEKFKESVGKKGLSLKSITKLQNSRQCFSKKVSSKIFTGQTFDSNGIICPGQRETIAYEHIRQDELPDSRKHQQKPFPIYQGEESFNTQERFCPVFQKGTEDNSEEYVGSESKKTVRRIKKNIWDIDPKRDNMEKIALGIGNDIAKSLSSNSEKTGGDCIEDDIIDCIQRISRDQKPATIRSGKIDGKFAQGNWACNAPTKVRECQKNPRDTRKRNTPMLYADHRSKFHSCDRERHAESFATQHSQKSSQDNASTYYRNAQENCRRHRSDDRTAIRNVLQKDHRSTIARSTSNSLEKKSQISIHKSVRSFRNTNSEGSRKRYNEERSPLLKHFMDGSQKVCRCWKNEKNGREILRENDNSCTAKNSMEENRPRGSIFSTKNEHFKKGCGNGKKGRDSTCKINGNSHIANANGHDNSFWDFYRTNVWDYSREVPLDYSRNSNLRKDTNGFFRKSTRDNSQKISSFDRKNCYRYPRKDFRDYEKKTIPLSSNKIVNSDSSCYVNSNIHKNVSADHKRTFTSDGKKNFYREECKSISEHCKNFSFGSRKNYRDPPSKILRDLSPRNVSNDVHKNFRNKPNKTGCTVSPKDIFDGSWKHVRSGPSKTIRCVSPQTTGHRESRRKADSPETFWDRAWTRVRSCSPRSTHIDAPKIGHFSSASFCHGSTKSSSLTPRLHSASDKSKTLRTSSSTTERQHSGKTFGNFPWPTEYMYRSHYVGNDAPWNVLGESKPNAQIHPLFCHPTDRYTNAPTDIPPKTQYLQNRNSQDRIWPTVRFSKKSTVDPGVNAESTQRQSVSGNEREKSMEHDSKVQDDNDVTRTTNEADLGARKEDSRYDLGTNVRKSGKQSRKFRKHTWDSCPWVVRSLWGIHDNQNQSESEHCSPTLRKDGGSSLVSSAVNESSSKHITSVSSDEAPTK